MRFRHTPVVALVAALVLSSCSSGGPATDTTSASTSDGATATTTSVDSDEAHHTDDGDGDGEGSNDGTAGGDAETSDGTKPDTDSSSDSGGEGDAATPTENATDGEGEAGSPTADTPTIVWERLDAGVEAGLLDVPIDYDDPSKGTIELYLVRHAATDQENKVGTLLVNPGGPGFGGSILARRAPGIYGDELVRNFDIIGWDPRGTGESEPAIDCIDVYDDYFGFDSTPDSEEAYQTLLDSSKRFADECRKNNAAIIDHVGTNNSARDMDSIRRALGEDKISYFGFSYGSELGAAWTTLFPDTVRAAVLDGAADPNADALEGSRQQSVGFENSLATFLAECSERERCAFHNDGDAEGAFDKLMASLDAEPVKVRDDRIAVNRDVAMLAAIWAMYDESRWTLLTEGLAAAQDGDPSQLLDMHDAYYQRNGDGTYGNELEAFVSISCVDDATRYPIEEAEAFFAKVSKEAPRMIPEGSRGGAMCTNFAVPDEPRVEITGKGAGPVLVIGTTGDPATPLDSTRKMAKSLEDGRLIVVEADQHTGYRVNGCINDVVHDYLIDLKVPADGTECR